jgi:hypothetical protein
MNRCFKLTTLVLALALALGWQGISGCYAGEKPDITGWEKGGPYDKRYDLSEYDNFKGKVVDIKEIVPMPGMAPGIMVVVRDNDDELVNVHLGPKSFVEERMRKFGLKKGDRVKVKGAWAEIKEEDVFMASKIKKGEYEELKVRLTKDGTPFWEMTSEELAKEMGQQGQ